MLIKRTAAALLAVILSAALLVLPGWALDADSDTVRPGIDVSNYQGDIDFQRVKDAGIEVVYIKASQGSSWTDPDFQSNGEKAKAAGLDFGFYHFVTATTTAEAEQEARFFASLITGMDYTCRPVMDFEEFSGLSHTQINAIGKAFLEELESLTGVKPMLYTDAYAANTLWEERFGAYPLWVANYDVSEPEVTSGIWSGWAGFQYGSGRVDGISDTVDLDRFTDAVLLTGEEKPTPAPDPKPDPAPPEDDFFYDQVQAGDTLWGISRRYDTTVEAIAALNGIRDPNRIYVGEILKIPKAVQDSTTYTVVPGDTLWAIAVRYDTTVEAIADLNGLRNPNLIYPGELLRIPS